MIQKAVAINPMDANQIRPDWRAITPSTITVTVGARIIRYRITIDGHPASISDSVKPNEIMKE
jgi:hypothetical protein